MLFAKPRALDVKVLLGSRGAKILGNDKMTKLDEITVHCKYYSHDDFNSIKELDDCKQAFSILHLTCRSLKQHHTDICVLLESLQHKIDTIAVSETWLCSLEHDLFSLEGYTSNFTSRDKNERWWCWNL